MPTKTKKTAKAKAASTKNAATKVTKATKKKTSKKKTVAKTRPTKRAAKKPGSVDQILTKFAKERDTLNSSLTTIQKKIADFEAKISDYQAQVKQLKLDQTSTQSRIDDLDSRRDHEVSVLLTKLGVQVTNGATDGPQQPSLFGNEDFETETKPTSADSESKESAEMEVVN